MQTVVAKITPIQNGYTFSIDLEKVTISIAIITAILFTLLAWAVVPDKKTENQVYGKNIIPYQYSQSVASSVHCYQQEQRIGRVLIADTNCR